MVGKHGGGSRQGDARQHFARRGEGMLAASPPSLHHRDRQGRLAVRHNALTAIRQVDEYRDQILVLLR
jgi:hypothetical protein